ncbi:hypothetical protein V5O48_012703 [Marasmius crinis-equi]|uniref:Uncharacterized protein n=1 Tax=Marasmius crinis-equi TaxID=585013 RepID=A0ABR3F243_9AGAR
MFFKLSSLSQLAVAAMFMAGAANAEQGWAHLNGTDGLTTRSCGTVCPPTPFKVALPIDQVNPVKCCATIHISFNGINTQGTYTDICTNCRGGNITLSEPLFRQFEPTGDAPFFAVWNQ